MSGSILHKHKRTLNTTAMVKLSKENTILKGMVQRQFRQITELYDRVTYLSAKSMENNLIISGIEEKGKDEDCVDTMLTFFRETLEIDANAEEIMVAYRMGKFSKYQKFSRRMMVRCDFNLKERAMANSSVLKDKKNATEGGYYVNKQLPEQMQEQKREMRETIKEIKDRESALPNKEKSQISVRNQTVLVDGSPVKKAFTPPEPLDILPENAEKDKIEKVKLSSSDIESEKGSDFQAFALKTGQLVDVKRTYAKVRQLHPAATHVVAAHQSKQKKFYQDDGEHGAGYRLAGSLKKEQGNVAVFVVRNYGGQNLGPRRFELINKVAQQAIQRISKG